MIILLLLLNINAFASTCPSKEHWVRPHHRSGYIRGDGVAVSATFVSGHCQSNPQSTAIWGNKFKAGIPDRWPHLKEKMKAWNETEKERVLEIIDQLPDIFSQINDVLIYRMISSQSKDNPASSAANIIVLYDDAFKDDRKLKRVLLHELAHEHYRRLSNFEQTTRNIACGWEQGHKKWIKTNSKTVADDSDLTPEEAFANAIEYFYFEPTRLKYKDSVLFDWLTLNYKDRIKK